MAPSEDDAAVKVLDKLLKQLRDLANDTGLSDALKTAIVCITDDFSHALARVKRTRLPD